MDKLVDRFTDKKTYMLALAGGVLAMVVAFIASALLPALNAVWLMLSFGGAIPIVEAMNSLTSLSNSVTGNLLVNFIALSVATLLGITIVLPLFGKPLKSILGLN